MKLDQIQIDDFRNLKSVAIQPSPVLNFIFGQNGSGKSSFLEAIHYFGFGRSFRTSKHKNVVQYDAEKFSIFCIGKAEEGEDVRLGLSRDKSDGVRVSVNGLHSNKVSELVSFLPVQVFTPQSSDLILGSPGLRRKYLDWGLFHVEQSYSRLSANYRRVVKQKNALLRMGRTSGSVRDQHQASYWDQEFVRYGNEISNAREGFIKRLEPHILSNIAQFLPEFSVKISYYRGWEKEQELAEALTVRAHKDIERGYVSLGPHKADLRLKIDGVSAAEVLSRGQLRMLVAAMQLAQIQCLTELTNKKSLFLLDDVGAELDAKKRELFIDELLKYDTQLFITAIEKEQIGFIHKYKEKKMFHVEHGQVREEN